MREALSPTNGEVKEASVSEVGPAALGPFPTGSLLVAPPVTSETLQKMSPMKRQSEVVSVEGRLRGPRMGLAH